MQCVQKWLVPTHRLGWRHDELRFVGSEAGIVWTCRGATTGWYADDENYVALTMDEFADTWTLTQWVGGVDVQTDSSTAFLIETGVFYDVELSFDGTQITGSVDGVQVVDVVVNPGQQPDGTVGFGVFERSAELDQIEVSTVTPSRGLFWDDFENGDTLKWAAVMP